MLLTCHQLCREALAEWYGHLVYPVACDNASGVCILGRTVLETYNDLPPSHFNMVRDFGLSITLCPLQAILERPYHSLALLVAHINDPRRAKPLTNLNLQLKLSVPYFDEFKDRLYSEEDFLLAFVETLHHNLYPLRGMRGLSQIQSSLALGQELYPDTYSWMSIRLAVIFRKYMEALESHMKGIGEESVTPLFSPGPVKWEDYVKGDVQRACSMMIYPYF
jgi:hypothetical protein